MNIKATIFGATMGALGLVGANSAALAGTTTPPGERAGVDLATPLPEGVYFVDLGGIGSDRGAVTKASTFDYNVPIIAWATPWTIGAGRIQLIAAAPEASIAVPSSGPWGPLHNNSAYIRGMYNPFLAAQYAYNFGNGFSASYLAGAYIAVDGGNNTNPFDQTTFHQQLALAYHGGGWNATANLMYGIVGNGYGGVHNSDYFNYDLGLTHTFGKWEVGIIGYGSVTSTINPYYLNGFYQGSTPSASQFALGGLVGYNFGPVITHVALSTDVADHNYGSHATYLNIHVIIPLWNPEAPKAVVAKY